MKVGVGSILVTVGVVLVLGGCDSADSKNDRNSRYDNSSGGSAPAQRECLFDSDRDGFCSESFVEAARLDCDDSRAQVHPGADELLNAADDDCDGEIDEGFQAACQLTLEAPPGGCEQVTQLVALSTTACALTDSGRVLCWGMNSSGSLGTPDIVNATFPIAVPGVSGVSALATGANAICALAGDDAICWGAGSAFPFRVPLPTKTTQIALGSVQSQNGAVAVTLTALDDTGQTWTRPLLATDAAMTAAPLTFAKSEAGVKALVGGGLTTCVVTTAGDLLCPKEGVLSRIAAQVEVAVQSYDGSLCYKSGGELYCSDSPAAGAVIAGSGSAVGFALARGVGCAFNDAGKLACWTANGPTSVADAAQVALGALFGCVRRKSGTVSCWGSHDGGRLGDGTVRPGVEAEPVDVLAGPELALPPIVLLGAAPLGACDTLQDLNALVLGLGTHASLAACKEQCVNTLDPAACFASCAVRSGGTQACFACYTDLAQCQGPDCYAAFQTCAGYPVDFAAAVSNAPRFECSGASCLHGKSVGQTCTAQEGCFTGNCSSLKQAPGIKVCTAADGAFCRDDAPYCSCNLGTDDFTGRPLSYGYCGGCSGEGRIASAAGDCYRDCTRQSYCTIGQTCKYFSDNRSRYCY